MTLIFVDIPPKMSMKNSPPIDLHWGRIIDLPQMAEFIELPAGCTGQISRPHKNPKIHGSVKCYSILLFRIKIM